MLAITQFVQEFSGFHKLEQKKLNQFKLLFDQALAIEEKLRVIHSTFEGVPLDPAEQVVMTKLFAKVMGQNEPSDIDRIVNHSMLFESIFHTLGREAVSNEIVSAIHRFANNEREAEEIRCVLAMNSPSRSAVREALWDMSAATMLHLGVLLNLKPELLTPILEVAAQAEWTEAMQIEYCIAYRLAVENKLAIDGLTNFEELTIEQSRPDIIGRLDHDFFIQYKRELKKLTYKAPLDHYHLNLLRILLKDTPNLEKLDLGLSGKYADSNKMGLLRARLHASRLRPIEIGTTRIKVLTEALSQMQELQELYLYSDDSHDPVAIAVVEVARHLPKLKVLKLNDKMMI